MLASISLGGGPLSRTSSKDGTSSSSNVVCDMAMAKDEVKARLAPIPVYTVANPKNEFVLVAGEIREENPRLARDSKILRVTMDNVYEVFTTPREQTGLQGIHFRFMPDMQQVSHALELYKEAGVPTRSFVGVPVFQAEGLTVTTQEMQYVPLFLCKEDLGIAVQSAYKQRNATQIKLYRDKAKKHEDDFNQVAVQANSASGREKAALESRAAKAKAKYDAAREKAEAVERAPLPKIEVGSFEEVMMRMTGSSGNELAAWSQVMFVAPNLLRQAVLKDDVTTAGK
ncbi:Tic22-like family-domain-containing protein [Dunaliella salina]|uniref:Tic22-like family-domain-containing protein n=1 Tax=Dunaliella salina TaxID=3046 RepID=A0ABQ7H860_DUNSA|nr:Tic22-like family-domain-containing protein [Dunaliella salina]|eukprot:KAF5843038.1 Tic22-like family-domain-containing protein [Dunaliella salina]